MTKRGYPHDAIAPPKGNPRYGGGDGLELDAKANSPKCQDPVNAHAPGYDNEVPVKSWLRGGGEDATTKPGFDHSKKGR